ncbi:hypothetical protein COU76_00825 [Candidatus Peregrinibacteria bacterium CG10_big_fil_rev_8_21_14_0_10_49_10]|nr:MAG: hypothetical protein COU76_00825 [Candidatus Peregrinibacteria bacterium CG10_big_fil_rev_8_21_14_0_10_49_10]
MHSSSKLQDPALLLLRLLIAAIFLYAGHAKWSMWSTPPEGMTPNMVNLMKLLAVVEPLGGLGLLVGCLTFWASAGLGIIMVGAVYFLRVLMHGALFTGPQGTGIDYVLLILAGCIVLMAFGPGKWSLDALRKKA